MKIVGLITEYNPFHKGHEYHIRRAKEVTGADACVVIMSGNYVQRGTPAFADKYTRTTIALNHGADVVFELPVPFATASAEFFAYGAVTLLHKMGCVDYICFGSECEHIDKLEDIANTLADAKTQPDHPLNQLIRDSLKSGQSYASSRSEAIGQLLGDHYKDVMDKPNNILAIEYLKAIKLLNSPIKPVSITRAYASYHHSDSNEALYSASSIRNALSLENPICQDVLNQLYEFDELYKDVINNTCPITENDFSTILIEKILSLSNSLDGKDVLTDYSGIDDDLANRMCNPDILYNFHSFTEYADLLKTKNIAYTALSRALLALILGIKKSHIDQYLKDGVASYVRLLGFKKDASPILNHIKHHGQLTIIGQLSEVTDLLPLTVSDRKMLSHSVYCDQLYNMIAGHKYKTLIPNEYTRKLIIK